MSAIHYPFIFLLFLKGLLRVYLLEVKVLQFILCLFIIHKLGDKRKHVV